MEAGMLKTIWLSIDKTAADIEMCADVSKIQKQLAHYRQWSWAPFVYTEC